MKLNVGRIGYRVAEITDPSGYGLTCIVRGRFLGLHDSSVTSGVQRLRRLLSDEGYAGVLYRDDAGVLAAMQPSLNARNRRTA